MEKILNITGKDGVLDGKKLSKAMLTSEPAIPQLYDLVEVERDTFTGDSSSGRLELTPTGKKKTYHRMWNGRGWAEVGQGKDERITIHE